MMREKLTFLNWTRREPIEIEIPDGTEWHLRVRAAIKIAADSGFDLRGCDLRGYDLNGLDLSGLDLSRSDMSECDLSGANLRDSVLRGSNLRDSNLNGANLDGSNLNGVTLAGAKLAGANLNDGASLRAIRCDFFDVLLRSTGEVDDLLVALRAGRIDGLSYTGECACLVGTIANSRGVSHHSLGFADQWRPAERWFLAIKIGDRPETNPFARITESWIVEFQALISSGAS